jgi:predicted TIM-barrel fold metal-dependent hydrolase
MRVNQNRRLFSGFFAICTLAVASSATACRSRANNDPSQRNRLPNAAQTAVSVPFAPDVIASATGSERDVAAVQTALTGQSTPPSNLAQPYARASLPVLDMHTHIDPTSTSVVLRLFNDRGIHTAINLSAGWENAGLEEALTQQQQSNNRILPFCTLPWRATGDPRFVSASVEILERCHARGVKGLKIPKVLGLGASDIDGTRLKVDAPRLDPIFQACERLGMMVLIHSGDPRAFFQPANPQNERWEELQAHPGWSFARPGFPTFDEILTEFEHRVLRHPRVVFIGAHFGNAAEDPARVSRLLERAPRYYIDTAARVPEFGRHPAATMRAFFTRWQDRVVFGTDLGLGPALSEWMLGSQGDEPTTQRDVDRFFTATWRYFEGTDEVAENPTPIQGRWPVHPVGLSPAILQKIYGGNAARLLGLPWPPPSTP